MKNPGIPYIEPTSDETSSTIEIPTLNFSLPSPFMNMSFPLDPNDHIPSLSKWNSFQSFNSSSLIPSDHNSVYQHELFKFGKDFYL